MLVLLSGCIDLIQDESGSASLIGSKANPADEAFHSVESSVLGVATNISTDAEVPIDVELSRNKGHGTYIASSRGKKVLNSQLIFNTADFNAHTGSLTGMGYRDHYVSGIFQDRYYFEYNYTSKWFVVNVGAFSENIFGGMTGRSTTTVENVSSGDSIEVCGGNLCNVTKASVNITNSANKSTLLTLSSNQTHGTHQVFLNTTFSSSCGQTNMSDVKYYSADGTLIRYWNQSTITSQYANWWLNVSSINNGSTYFYRECGETGLSSTSSIFATGLNGSDDFSTDLSNWTLTQSAGGNVQIVSGEARIEGSGAWNANGMTSNVNFARPVVLEWQSRTSALIHGYEGYGVQPLDIDSGLYFRREGGIATLYRVLDGALLEVGTKSTALTTQKIVLPSIGYTIYWNEIEEETDTSWATDNNKLTFQTFTNGQYMYVPWVFTRNGTTANITWLDEGAELNISANFTAGTHESANYNITDGAFDETLSSVQNIQNVTVEWNGYGTSTVAVTVFTSDDPLQTTKTYANGYKTGTMYINHDANLTNVLAIANLDNASVEYSGTIVNQSNDQNVTDIRYNSTNVIWNSTQVNNSVTHWYNFSLPVNNASINDQTNQTCEWNLTCTITTSASDVDGASQINYTTTINGTTVYGANPEFTNTSQLTIGTHDLVSNVTDKNGTIGDAPYSWSNLSKVLTISDTIAPYPVTNLANTTLNFSVNWTWTNPTESDWSHTEVWINTNWKINTSNTYYNWTSAEGLTVNVELKSADVRDNVNSTTVTDSVTMNGTAAQSNQIIGGW